MIDWDTVEPDEYMVGETLFLGTVVAGLISLTVLALQEMSWDVLQLVKMIVAIIVLVVGGIGGVYLTGYVILQTYTAAQRWIDDE